MFDSLQPYEPQHASPPCLSPTPGVYPNSCPLSRWCHPTILSSVVPVSSCHPSFPVSGSFSALHIRWPKNWSFSFNISPSNEHLGLISFRMDWLDLLAVQETLKGLLQPQFRSINSSELSFLYGPTLAVCSYFLLLSVLEGCTLQRIYPFFSRLSILLSYKYS